MHVLASEVPVVVFYVDEAESLRVARRVFAAERANAGKPLCPKAIVPSSADA